MKPLLSFQQVSVRLGSHWALREVDLQLHAGERVALVGANGCGKSTLLRLAHGLIAQTQGELHRDSAPQAMLFQRPHMLRCSVQRFVALGLWLQGVPWRLAHAQALPALARVGLLDQAQQPARTLSGGQQQRLALARAWALNPQWLLLDEPTSSLDPHAKREVEQLVREWITPGRTLLFSSHNLGQVKRLATRVIYLEAGRVLADLPVDHFFHQPLAETHPQAHLFLKGELT